MVMNAATPTAPSSRTLTVGTHVVLTPEYVQLFERPDLALVIHEVVDVRGAGRNPSWTIAPVGARGVDYRSARVVWGEDLRQVGQ